MCKGYGKGPAEERETKQMSAEKKEEIQKENSVADEKTSYNAAIIEKITETVSEKTETSTSSDESEETRTSSETINVEETTNKAEAENTSTNTSTETEIKPETNVDTDNYLKRENAEFKAAATEVVKIMANKIGSFFSGFFNKFTETKTEDRTASSTERTTSSTERTMNSWELSKSAANTQIVAEKHNIPIPHAVLDGVTSPNLETKREAVAEMDRIVITAIKEEYKMDPQNPQPGTFTEETIARSERITDRVNELIGRKADENGKTESHFLGYPEVLDRLNSNCTSTTVPDLTEMYARIEMRSYTTNEDVREMIQLVNGIDALYDTIETFVEESETAIPEDVVELIERQGLYGLLFAGETYGEIHYSILDDLSRAETLFAEKESSNSTE